MNKVSMRFISYLTAFLLLVVAAATLAPQQTASARAFWQTMPIDNGTIPATPTDSGTIPPTPTPAGTLPEPFCPPEIQQPEPGKIIVFLAPVAIYSGCAPQAEAAGLGDGSNLIPTLLYHDPADGFPTGLGYVGEPFAIFDYSPDEMDRLITVLEAYKCEELGMALAPCRQVNGIRLSGVGFTPVTASEMRAGIDAQSPNAAAPSMEIYLPLTIRE